MATSPTDDDWELVDRVMQLCLARLPDWVDRVVARVAADVPGYARIPAAQLRAEVEVSVVSAATGIREHRLPSAAELELVAALATSRARDGHPVEELLQAYRLGMREAWAFALEVAEEAASPHGVVLAATAALWDWADAVTTHAVAAHHEADALWSRESEQRRSYALRQLLSGVEEEDVPALAQVLGIDPSVPHAVLVARAVDPGVDVEAALLRCGAVVHVLPGGDVVGVSAAPPAALEGVCVGLAGEAPLARAAAALPEAERALHVALAHGLTGVQDLPSLALHAVVVAEPSLGAHLARTHLRPLLDAGAFGQELLRTLRVLLAHDLRMDATAAALHVQPSTLRHRLRRAEGLTGLRLARLRDVARLAWALEHQSVFGDA